MDKSNSTALNLIGQKFGKLTVISRAENSKSNKTRWNCVCDCGNTSIPTGSALKNGKSSSCGCNQRVAASNVLKKRFDDITGKKFNRLLVLNRIENKNKKPWFLCKCDCGNLKEIAAQRLRSGTTKSCGCYKLEIKVKQLTKHGLSRTKEYLRQKARRKYIKDKQNPKKLMELRIKDLIRKSLTSRKFRKNNKSYEILGCSYDEFRNHIEKQFTNGMNWEKFGEIHIDHIVPLATAKTIDDVIALNHFTNLRPMWAKDNIKKSDNIEFLI